MQIRTALKLSGQSVAGEITGFINVGKADQLLDEGKIPNIVIPVRGDRGRGSLEGARGGRHVFFNGFALTGERDIFGKAWNGADSAAATQTMTSWSGGTFNQSTWAGASWAGASWAGAFGSGGWTRAASQALASRGVPMRKSM